MRACSTCCAPIVVSRPDTRWPARENGGFITITVGVMSWGSAELRYCASIPVTPSRPRLERLAIRFLSISLAQTRAPVFLENTARLPFPALGSKTMSPGLTLAAQLAR